MSTDVSNCNSVHSTEKINSSLPQPMRCTSRSQSDWAVLNSTDAGRVRRLLRETDGFTVQRIEQACRLIENYHAVYRRDLVKLRRQGCFGRCPLPTSKQLQQIAKSLNEKENQSYSATYVLIELRALAEQLRAVRSKLST